VGPGFDPLAAHLPILACYHDACWSPWLQAFFVSLIIHVIQVVTPLDQRKRSFFHP